MNRLPAILFALLVAAQAAHAGTASDPEAPDPAGDDVSSIPGLGANSIDITGAWVASESPDDFVFHIDTGGSYTPDPSETQAYEWTIDLGGTEYVFGAEVFNGGTVSTSPTGIASAAAPSGGIMTVTVPRSEFAGIEPGMQFFVTEVTSAAYVGSPLWWSHTDSAVGSKPYTIGALADPSMDFDGDGIPDRDEVRQGSDPTDPADPPAAVPPVVASAFEARGGSFSLQAETPISDGYQESWQSTLEEAIVTFTATIESGSLSFLLEDNETTLSDTALTASISDNMTFTGTFPGTWNLTITPDNFVGQFLLAIEGPDDKPTGTTETETDEPTDDHGGHEEEPAAKKSTPFPAAGLLAAVGLALRLRKE